MSQSIPIDRLEPHPANANVMSADALGTLRRHVERSGRYEPLVVRLLGGEEGCRRYQVLNGHHRLEVLKRLGHAAARCEVWDVDDREAMLLLATLNRLEGRDDPVRRAALLAALADGQEAGEVSKLARLLPESRAALDRALALAREPLPLPADPGRSAAAFSPVTFFLTADELGTVNGALRLAGRAGAGDGPARGRTRAAALVALAEHFVAARGADTLEATS